MLDIIRFFIWWFLLNGIAKMLDIIRFFIWWFLLNGIVSLYIDDPTPFYWVILIITGVMAFIMIYQKK